MPSCPDKKNFRTKKLSGQKNSRTKICPDKKNCLDKKLSGQQIVRTKKLSGQKNCLGKKIVRTKKWSGQKNFGQKMLVLTQKIVRTNLFLSALSMALIFCPSGPLFVVLSNFFPYSCPIVQQKRGTSFRNS